MVLIPYVCLSYDNAVTEFYQSLSEMKNWFNRRGARRRVDVHFDACAGAKNYGNARLCVRVEEVLAELCVCFCL